MTENFEKRINKMVLALDRARLEEKIDQIHIETKSLIFIKNILEALELDLTELSLNQLKLEINKMALEKNNLTMKLLNQVVKVKNALKKDFSSKLEDTIKDIKNLLSSWEDVNETFEREYVSDNEFKEVYEKIENLINVDDRLNSETNLEEIIKIIKEEAKELLKKKIYIEQNINAYWEDFPDQEFIQKLVKGEELSFKDLTSKMYEKINKSDNIKDKIYITLKKG